jgi:hypothetical protein
VLQQPAPQTYAPQYPVQYSQPQQYTPQPQAPTRPQVVNTHQKYGEAKLSDLLSLQEQGKGQPGQGALENPDPCPGCGSPLFIENLPGGKKRRGPAPAPHCFSCGWNGLFDQGLESSWAG